MSRTHNDRPRKIQYLDTRYSNCEVVEYICIGQDYYTKEPREYTRRWYKEIPGSKTKKKKHTDIERHLHTPNWWISMYMTQPQRTAGKAWERKAVKVANDELDALDTPSVSRRPYIYYW